MEQQLDDISVTAKKMIDTTDRIISKMEQFAIKNGLQLDDCGNWVLGNEEINPS